MLVHKQVIPIVHVSECLLGILYGHLYDVDVEELKSSILNATSQTHPRAVILDFSTIQIIDSFMSRILLELVLGIKLLGSQMIMVGIPNPVIITLVELGVSFPIGIASVDLDTAFAMSKNDKRY